MNECLQNHRPPQTNTCFFLSINPSSFGEELSMLYLFIIHPLYIIPSWASFPLGFLSSIFFRCLFAPFFVAFSLFIF